MNPASAMHVRTSRRSTALPARVRRSAVAAATVLALVAPLSVVTSAGTAVAAGRDGAAVVPARVASTSEGAADPVQETLRLPRPTGRHAVGRDTLHLVDRSRTDPWVPQAGARELMVSMYFPARRGPAPAVPRT